jgi:sulfane dehydrogenase subunit SoxC
MDPEARNIIERGRRRFLKNGFALAGLAVGAIRSGSGQTPGSQAAEERPKDTHAYGERSRFENSARILVIPNASNNVTDSMAKTPLQDGIGIITPSSLHFWITRFRSDPPDIDPRQHRLMIHGLVDRPLIFTMEELKRLPSESRIHFLECAGNSSPYEFRKMETVQHTHGLTSCCEWTGVPLSLLLREAGLQKGASWLIAESADAGKHTKSIPLEKAMDDVLVAYGQNGEAVRREQGYPLRLLVPGFEGLSNVKWLRRIKVVDQPYMARVEAVDYAVMRPILKGKALWFNFQLGPKSVITFPSGGQRLPGPGFYEITGLAWSGGGAIGRVEVSTNGGRTWKDAQVQEPVHRIAHTRFRLDWNWDGGEALLQSRCTDDRGEVQPTVAEIGSLYGVNPDYFKTTENRINHFNAIQSWKLTSDGDVRNAMFS